MNKFGAISCVYDWSHGYDIENTIDYSSKFSDTIYSNVKLPSKGIAFISIDSEHIRYVMKYKKTGRVATKTDRISFANPVNVDPPIPIKSLKENLPPKLQKHFENQTNGGVSSFSPKVYSELMSFFTKQHPGLFSSIKKLISELDGVKTNYRGNSAEVVAHEKDAISLALRISGFKDNDLPNWSQSDETAPFLTGFDEIVLREDPMVIHDSQVFGEWEKISQYIVGAAEFTKDGHKLTIMNANRHKIEETIGVDLIMYHHSFKSYVLIQYKRLVKDGDILSYRPIDKSYIDEIKRMEEFQEKNVTLKGATANDFRLNNEFFYFKLCQSQIKNPLSTEMISGMYLPLSYWKILLNSEITLGERGGRLLSYSNVKRYITNTLFIKLVQHGWVGSQLFDTEAITQKIQEAIAGNRSVILANYEQIIT